jgi:hypothetical protein
VGYVSVGESVRIERCRDQPLGRQYMLGQLGGGGVPLPKLGSMIEGNGEVVSVLFLDLR